MVGENPLGTFIKGMLADYQQRKMLQLEMGKSMGLETFKSNLEQQSPLYQAQTKAYETLGTKREEGSIEDKIKEDAWAKYQAGDRSPSTLKSVGKWVSPMEAIMAQSMGLYIPETGQLPSSLPENPVNPLLKGKPKYNPKTEKLQYNKKTGEYRIVRK